MTLRRSIFCIFLALSTQSGNASEGTGFVALFDGESLAGWTTIGGKPGNWRVQDAMLVTLGRGKDWLSTNRQYSDFEIELEYRTGPAGNSGLLIRAPHKGDPSFDGMEIQILDDEAPAYKSLQSFQYTGSVYGVLASRRGFSNSAGEWNSLKVRAEGSRISVDLNGTRIVDGNVAEHPESLPRHSGIKRTSGYIGLQSHENPVQFRRIAIRELR